MAEPIILKKGKEVIKMADPLQVKELISNRWKVVDEIEEKEDDPKTEDDPKKD